MSENKSRSRSAGRPQAAGISWPGERFLLLLLVNFLITLAVFGVFAQPKYAVDTYTHAYLTGQEIAGINLGSGRTVSALITAAMGALGINDATTQWLYFATLVASLTLCATLLTWRTCRMIPNASRKQIVLVDIAWNLAYANVFFAPWFMYVEASMLTAAGCLLTCGAALVITGEGRGWKRVLLSLLLAILATNIYQVFFENFVIISCALLLVRHRTTFSGKAVAEIVIVLCVALAGIILSLALSSGVNALMNVQANSRSATMDMSVILANVRNIHGFQSSLWVGGLSLLPSRFLAAVGLALAAILAVLLIVRKTSWLSMAMVLAVFLGCYVLVYAPHLVSPVFWPAERTLFPFFAIFSMALVLIALHLGAESWMNAAALAVGVVMLAVNITGVQNMGIDQHVTNALDRQYAKQLGMEIAAYEAETGIEVTHVGLVLDMYPSYGYYEWVDAIYKDTNLSARVVDWTFAHMLNFYLDDHLAIANVPEEIAEQFRGKNWTSFIPEEQLIFDGDTLYVCAY